MHKKKRVVITGLGVVSCFGTDVDQFYQSLLDGKSGIQAISHFDCSQFPTRFAGVIPHFDSGEYLDKKQARRVDKCISYGIVAGKKALEHAGLFSAEIENLDRTRCGVLLGSGMGGMGVYSDGIETFLQKGPKWVTPFFVPYILTNMPGGLLAMDVGFMGPNYSISTACATGNNSIIAAARHIRNGEADLMVSGGVEGAIIPIGLAGFCACKALSQRNDAPTRASRPWDRGRDGFVLGEGAGVLVMESLEHALKRGASILAEFVGGGLSCDAHHITEPHPGGEGVAQCIRNALNDAEINPEEVNLINAHATSTPLGDMAEVNALKKIFSNPKSISMNATKSMTGHLLGGAGGIEAVATVKAITEGVMHPTINLEDPEPDLLFDTPTKAKEIQVKYALSNSFGFGGHNASIILAPYRS